jgi:membrane protein YqaA with SNARE-associated domain
VIAGIAVAWGFAEATLFFIVADMLISYVTVYFGLRRGLEAAFFATIGAIAGGAAMYRWGVNDAAGVVAAIDGVPAISAGMIADVRQALAGDWQSALFGAAFTGVPYKIFPALAPAAGIAMPIFLLVSVPARLVRFLALWLVTGVLSRLVATRLGKRQQILLLTLIWTVLYALYWISTPG